MAELVGGSTPVIDALLDLAHGQTLQVLGVEFRLVTDRRGRARVQYHHTEVAGPSKASAQRPGLHRKRPLHPVRRKLSQLTSLGDRVRYAVESTCAYLASKSITVPSSDRIALNYFVIAVLGFVVAIAGLFKGYAAYTDPDSGDAVTLCLMALAQFEVVFGLWLALASPSNSVQRFAVLCFGSFLVGNLYQLVAGHCSCGCFGRIIIHPLCVALFDIGALIVLIRWFPAAAQGRLFFSRTLAISTALITTLLIVTALVRYQPDRDITITGMATLGRIPLSDSSLVFHHENGILKRNVRTDANGRFPSLVLRPGNYKVTASRLESKPDKLSRHSSLREAVPTKYSGVDRTPLAIKVPLCGRRDIDLLLDTEADR